ncbi:MAG TPA: anti-sigma factor [Solirubrobacterales bacterium]|nr:anti-sigma factor [Solirubrobacterales bacterium]
MTDREKGVHEEMHDDLAAYAVGALPPDEAAELERHLDDCESCRARLRWLQPAVDMLPASVEQLPPPEGLRERLMTTVREEADAPEQAGATSAGAERKRRFGGWTGFILRPATAVAAVVLIVAGVAAGYALRGDDGDATTTVAARAASPEFENAVSAELEHGDDSGTLYVRELPPIDRDEVYEVWVQRDGALEPASTFVLSMDGTAQAKVPGPLDDAEAVLVTREPRPGSEQPTNPPVLEAPLQ